MACPVGWDTMVGNGLPVPEVPTRKETVPMRKLLLTLALIGLLAIPSAAQFFPGGRGMTGDMILLTKSVQDELKLSDDQKKDLADIQKTQMDAFAEARPLFKEDREKAMDILKKAADATGKSLKKFKEGLTAKQSDRLAQIEIQLLTKNKNPEVFTSKAVTSALKLTPKQSELIKETLSDLAKDAKELQDEAKDDFKKGFEVAKKIATMRGEAYAKITKELTSAQKAALEKAQGEKFDMKMDNPFGKDFGKDKKGKKDAAKKPKEDS